MSTSPYSIDDIAQVCHEANRALQHVQNDPTIPVSPPWAEVDEETRESARAGVENALAGATPEQSHEAWLQFKLANGWQLGPVKDEGLKQHPLLVPYHALPESQQVKDELFTSIVRILGSAP